MMMQGMPTNSASSIPCVWNSHPSTGSLAVKNDQLYAVEHRLPLIYKTTEQLALKMAGNINYHNNPDSFGPKHRRWKTPTSSQRWYRLMIENWPKTRSAMNTIKTTTYRPPKRSQKALRFQAERPHPSKKRLMTTTASMTSHIAFNWPSIGNRRILPKGTLLVLTHRFAISCWGRGARGALVDCISALPSMTL